MNAMCVLCVRISSTAVPGNRGTTCRSTRDSRYSVDYGNILCDESASRLGIIDFSEAGKEDPALDFMYMCYFPEEFSRAVFEEYWS